MYEETKHYQLSRPGSHIKFQACHAISADMQTININERLTFSQKKMC